MTNQSINNFLNYSERLTENLENYLHSKGKYGKLSIENGGFWLERNTSCHCHPEYKKISVDSKDIENFISWNNINKIS